MFYMDPLKNQLDTGTTIVACEYDKGVIIGADSRAFTGPYVANRVADKLTKITDHIYCCRSGSVADTQFICDAVKYRMNLLKVELGQDIPLVKTAASIFQELCYNYRKQMVAGIIVAGWDNINLAQLYCIPAGGMMLRQAMVVGGSGSSYVYGYLDDHFKPNMTKDAALDLVTTAVSLAIRRDGQSGGVARLGVISEEGVEKSMVLEDEMPKFSES